MHVLKPIIENKRLEISLAKKNLDLEKLKENHYFHRKYVSFSSAVKQSKNGIIAEFKRKSPSNSAINLNANPSEIVNYYVEAQFAAVSILTDKQFFGGSTNDILSIRHQFEIPILRKEFIIDPYQIYESKAIGADCILLIAAILSPEQILEYTEVAQEMGLEVLLEVHDEDEILQNQNAKPNLWGINNRNLNTLEINLKTSENLFHLLPDNSVKISESGISNPNTISKFIQLGFDGFLIGENFMKHENPKLYTQQFVNAIDYGN